MTLLSAIALTTGIWRAVLFTPGGELPFQIRIDAAKASYAITIINGEEHMLLDEVTVKGDSLIVRFPVYESELRLKMMGKDRLEGDFINLTRITHASIRMAAHAGETFRFPVPSMAPAVNVTGRWSVQFSPGNKDSSNAVGVFEQNGTRVTGTFLTTSGDYRYLEGAINGDSLFLSTFDGVFVYLFKAKITGNKLDGIFYSGTHRQVGFSGYRNNQARLPDAGSLTKYNEGENGLAFRLPDVDSTMVSLDDPQFKDKVVLIQILGSWCPNCLDESAFLAPYYDKNKNRGIEIIGLSFEKTDDFARASANVKRFRDKFKIHYPLLIAANRDKIKNVLPGLENFVGFPTTIYLDRKHRVRKVHAGFSGAATGAEYEKFKDDFSLLIDKLLAE
jgi:peroxiredoxin